ncbi:2-oxoglutarate (2OG) and Fe(II)-dependent oxygenase superfamily protein [Euphorbia peplus]|nr:2-oxoglutarate (2OG) and Fe(II)-dependent oxygenase superfamily protein [Euphorbia peplus]
MDSETVVPKIPVVDLSSKKLKPGSDSWNSACQEVRQALENYGCFELVYNKPSIDIFEAAEEVFKLPYEIKTKNINPKPAHGYIGKNSVVPVHEAVGIEYANNEQECQNFTQLMWPNGNQHFCETVHSYAKLAAGLQELLLKMLCGSYGIDEEHSESLIKSTTYLMRFLKYRRPSPSDSQVGFNSHTDKSFLSILHQNHVNGLRIRTLDGDEEWISYEPSSNSSFMVFAGDVLMAWSNDIIKSCYHRVRVENEEVRYTIGLFSFLEGSIEVPRELIDEEHQLQYKPFEHQAFLDFFMSTHGLNKDSHIIKSFCGI